MAKNYGRRKGGNAVGQCARSGRKMRLSEMVEDGYYPGILVDPRWRDAEHPLERFVAVIDDAAIDRPAPENHRVNMEVVFPTYNGDFSLNNEFEVIVELGNVSVIFA